MAPKRKRVDTEGRRDRTPRRFQGRVRSLSDSDKTISVWLSIRSTVAFAIRETGAF